MERHDGSAKWKISANMMPNTIKTVRIEEPQMLLKYLHEATDAFRIEGDTTSDFWWRGQPFDEPLRPRVFREPYSRRSENSYLLRFQTQATSRYSNCPEESNFCDWLMLAQHYGLATRLLDWSQSLLVAAFFATLKGHAEEQDGVLWALLPSKLNHLQLEANAIFQTFRDASGETAEEKKFFELFDGAFRESGSTAKAAAFLAKEIDIRMLIQLARFTIHSDDTPMESLPQSDSFLQRFIIPKDKKGVLRGYLQLLGIERSYLFPNLDNLTSQINEYDVLPRSLL